MKPGNQKYIGEDAAIAVALAHAGLAHRAFFLDDEEKDRAVALMRRVEAGVQVSMSYCINRAVSISPFDPFECFCSYAAFSGRVA